MLEKWGGRKPIRWQDNLQHITEHFSKGSLCRVVLIVEEPTRKLDSLATNREGVGEGGDRVTSEARLSSLSG